MYWYNGEWEWHWVLPQCQLLVVLPTNFCSNEMFLALDNPSAQPTIQTNCLSCTYQHVVNKTTHYLMVCPCVCMYICMCVCMYCEKRTLCYGKCCVIYKNVCYKWGSFSVQKPSHYLGILTYTPFPTHTCGIAYVSLARRPTYWSINPKTCVFRHL